MENGSDPNAPDNTGATPLYLAIKQGSLEIGKQLIEHGADMAILRSDGKSALDLAEEGDKKEKNIIGALSLHLDSSSYLQRRQLYLSSPERWFGFTYLGIVLETFTVQVVYTYHLEFNECFKSPSVSQTKPFTFSNRTSKQTQSSHLQ